MYSTYIVHVIELCMASNVAFSFHVGSALHVHCMCTAPRLHVHCMCTAYAVGSRHVHMYMYMTLIGTHELHGQMHLN